jgi:hypothetical protein
MDCEWAGGRIAEQGTAPFRTRANRCGIGDCAPLHSKISAIGKGKTFVLAAGNITMVKNAIIEGVQLPGIVAVIYTSPDP